MAHVETHADLELESPDLVEGLPGVGLVGKIATDHIVQTLDMDHYASCYCDGIPRAVVYESGARSLRPPVRIYADESRDLLTLQSDVPVSPERAPDFSTCLAGWFEEMDATPLCLSGLAQKQGDVPQVFGIGSGEGASRLDDIGLDTPPENGLISGPTGALLAEVGELGHDGIGLVVEANPQFPDPEAARALVLQAIEPLTGIDIPTEQLVEQAEEIASAKEKLAKQMQEATEESSQAKPLGMYQ